MIDILTYYPLFSHDLFFFVVFEKVSYLYTEAFW